MTTGNAPRLWLIDDNVVGTGGHFLELASLLAGGAESLGYAPRLAVHSQFNETHADLMCEPVFSVCLLYTSPSPRDMRRSRMPSSA